MTIDISRARLIGSNTKYPSDWMSVPELMWLAEHASTHNKIVEIGSWRGRSTRAMADNTNGVVFAVDPWSDDIGVFAPFGTKSVSPAGWFDSYGDHVSANDVFATFRNSTADLLNRKIFPFRMTSVQAANIFSDLGAKFDMVFIDGMHDYAYVYQDIVAWRSLLVPGGLLCGHDYWDPNIGVRQAVDELLPGANVLDDPAEGTVYSRQCIWWKVL